MKRFSLRYKLLVLTIVALGVVTLAADLPFTFQAGDLISAEQMNQNFAALNSGKQERVSGECAEGSAIRTIGADGDVTCETDDVGAGGVGYTAGLGLDLEGTQFSIDVAETQARVGGTCAAGSSIRSIGADGKVTCETDDLGASGGDAGVDSLNGMTGAITLQAGDNITIDDSAAGQLTIRAAGGGSYTADGTTLRLDGTTFSIADAGVDTAQLADGGVTGSKLAAGAVTAGTIALPLNLTRNASGTGLAVRVGTAPSSNFITAIQGASEGNRIGIHGLSGDGSGVQGTTTNGNGVFGQSENSTGVYGLARTDGAGVWGDSTSGFGVRGRSASNVAIHGESAANDAILGVSQSANHAGIVGVNNAGGFAAYFEAGGAVCSFKSGTTGWACSSDRNLKEGFEPVDTRQVLEAVAAMPVTSWTMQGSDIRQLGPTAQDFYAAFELGDSDLTINNTDAQGVALAAIQGLYQLVQEQQAKIEVLEARLSELQ